MHDLKYTVIKDKEQYNTYCDKLEELVLREDGETEDEIELLTLLIEKWDNEQGTLSDKDPIEMLKALMNENHLKAKDLVEIVGLSKGTISKILNYHTGLSKQTIRKLSAHFKVSQEAFNRPYQLKNQLNQINNRTNATARKLMVALLLLQATIFSMFSQATVFSLYSQDTTHIRNILESAGIADSIYFGTACHETYLGTRTETIMNEEFSYVTPANDFKQSYIHPYPGTWRWERSDAWIAHCDETKQVLRLHAPISPQVSTWAKDDSRTAEELETMLVEYISGLGQRYNNEEQIIWMDVVNEILNADGTWFGPKTGTDSWENPWPKMGYDETVALRPPIYIKRAFEVAAEHCSNFRFIINQHTDTQAAWDKLKQTVAYLRDNNLRVDGIGWQAHTWAGWEKTEGNMERLGAFIDWCHANDLEFHITEFNSWINNPHEEHWDEQAATFYAITKMAASKYPTGIVGINLWHIRATETSQPTRDGGPWADDYTRKPGYYRIKDALFEIANGIGPTIRSSPGLNAVIGQAYEYQLELEGAIGTPVYSVATDKTAHWLQIDENGMLNGTPAAEDTLRVAVTVTDNVGPRTQEFTLITYNEPLAITSSPNTDATVGYPYLYETGYTGEGTFSIETDPVASWLTVSQDGQLTGTPEAKGTFNVILSLTRNDDTVTQEFIILVEDFLEITSDPVTEATQGVIYNYYLAYRGSGTFSLQTDPEADWLTLNQDKILSGTPPAPDTIHVLISASNALTTVTQAFDLYIGEALRITSDPVTTATVGASYLYQVETTGTGTFSMKTNKPAEWLTMDSSGMLTGTPGRADTIQVTIKYSNDATSTYQSFRLIIMETNDTRAPLTTDLKVFPNPATSELVIKDALPGSELRIYDAQGKERQWARIDGTRYTLSIETLPPGLYLGTVNGHRILFTKTD